MKAPRDQVRECLERLETGRSTAIMHGEFAELARHGAAVIPELERVANEHPIWSVYALFYLGSHGDASAYGALERLAKGGTPDVRVNIARSLVGVVTGETDCAPPPPTAVTDELVRVLIRDTDPLVVSWVLAEYLDACHLPVPDVIIASLPALVRNPSLRSQALKMIAQRLGDRVLPIVPPLLDIMQDRSARVYIARAIASLPWDLESVREEAVRRLEALETWDDDDSIRETIRALEELEGGRVPERVLVRFLEGGVDDAKLASGYIWSVGRWATEWEVGQLLLDVLIRRIGEIPNAGDALSRVPFALLLARLDPILSGGDAASRHSAWWAIMRRIENREETHLPVARLDQWLQDPEFHLELVRALKALWDSPEYRPAAERMLRKLRWRRGEVGRTARWALSVLRRSAR